MTQLPAALVSWRTWLSWFDPELAVQIGHMMQRLHPLFGTFRGHRQGGEPEIEGLDDLRGRGPYERLIASEWLLADELPDEFLRRAASGEHIFLAPRPRARRATRSIIALFDAGPLQLGAPRLAHIAIWILLARRAQQAHGELHWGILQKPSELFEAKTPEHLRAFLFKRTFALPEDSHLDQWRDALAAQLRSGAECWAIGSAGGSLSAQAKPFTHRVALERDLGSEALRVSLIERGIGREVQLPLPDAELAAPLLRGSFTHEAAPRQDVIDPRALSLQRPPVIAFDGTRVAMALRDEPGALVFLVPRSPTALPSSPRHHRWSAGYSAVAAALQGKKLGVLLGDDGGFRFWPTSLTLVPCPTREEFHAPGSTAAWLSCAWLRRAGRTRVCVIDQSKRLFVWDDDATAQNNAASRRSLRLVSTHVLGMTQPSTGMVAYARHENGRVWFARLSETGDPEQSRFLCEAPADAKVLFGRGSLCAVRVSREPTESWRVAAWHDQHHFIIRLPSDTHAIGVMREPQGRCALITLNQKALRLHFEDGGNELIYTVPERETSVTVCQNSGVVAMMTAKRQLIVFSAATRELKMCVQTGAHRSQ
jgi:hypothetical protein